jgi:predicted nucleotidyltransferase
MPKTARDLSREEWRAYHPDKRYQILQNTPNFDREKRMENAMTLARAAAKLLKQKYGAKKVVLIGSLLNASRFTPWSDIDIAVWGIASDKYYQAVAVVTGMSKDYKIDLIDPETCRPALLEALEKDGQEI